MKNLLRFFVIFASVLSSAYAHEFERVFRLSNTIPSNCVEIKFPQTQFIGIISIDGVKDLKHLPKIFAVDLNERLLVDLASELKTVVDRTDNERGKFCSVTYGVPISAQLMEALLASDNIALYEADKAKFISAVNVRRIWSKTTIEYIMSVPNESGVTPLLISLNIISHAK